MSTYSSAHSRDFFLSSGSLTDTGLDFGSGDVGRKLMSYEYQPFGVGGKLLSDG